MKRMNHLKKLTVWCGLSILLAAFVAGCFKETAGEKDAEESAVQPVESEVASTLPEIVDFNEHIRPILSDRCYACHGPDAENQASPFRLDTQESSRLNLAAEGEPARYGIVPGKPEESTILSRITHQDPSQRMPPPSAKKKGVSPEEVALLTQWIRDGAEYEEHWAFVPPAKSELPTVKQQEWIRNEIDRFILAKLESVRRELDAERAGAVDAYRRLADASAAIGPVWMVTPERARSMACAMSATAR